MATRSFERSHLALVALELFPPSVRQSLISDPVFRDKYGLTVDAQIALGDSGLSVPRSKLFNGIREVFADSSARPSVRDAAGEEWRLELVENDNKRRVALSHGEIRFLLPDFSAISPEQAERISGFDQEVNDVLLPEHSANEWREVLTSRALADDEIAALQSEIEETPIRVGAAVDSEIREGNGNLSTLVPRSKRYFERLVGECKQSKNILDYARGGGREHIRELMSRRAYDGFLLSLLLSSHSSCASEIEADQLEERALVQAYEWLQRKGDRISQIGAIEIGLSILDRRPKIEAYLQGLIEQMRDDNVDNNGGRFHLLSALIILVEGELCRTKILRGTPPFWRRLASIAQASLIERSLIRSQVDIAEFSKWAMQARGQIFYLQTLADLRQEPRWQPEYVSPRQLKAELIGRIVGAAQRNTSTIHTPAMRELLFGESPEALRSLIEFPFAYLPGPLEGGLESQTVPSPEILVTIEKQLSSDLLQPNTFTALMNSALIFRLDPHQAQLAAKALRAGKHQLRQADNKEQLFSVLCGLATVSAVARSNELAKELRILTRRCSHEPGHRLSA